MQHPMTSIVVPVYNTSEYLAQCLDTIVNQTFRDIEIICVNDGSTDNSLKILEDFSSKDNRIIIVNRESASGSAALPRNMGLDMARGKYVMFLDSDDYFDLTMLEKMFDHAEKNGADLVMCDNYIVSTGGEISEEKTELKHKYLPKKAVFSYKDIPKTIFQISNAAVWHKLILRETLVKHDLKFQLNTPILDDIYFVNLLLILSERISIIPNRLIFYRSQRYGAQTRKIEKHKESIFLAFFELNKYLIEHSLYETVKISLQNWTLVTMAWWLNSIDNYDAFCELHDLYRNEYFIKLLLTDMEQTDIHEDLVRFYNSILKHETEPHLRVILESRLKYGSKIVIYGAGFVGKNIFKVVNTHGKHEIVLWCDKNADKIGNPLVKKPNELKSIDFDALIIAIGYDNVVNEVKNYLNEIGINSQKIYVV